MKPVARNLEKLRCPECHGSFKLTEYPATTTNDGEYGVLECGCNAYPVLDSVPILLRGSVAQFSFGTGDIESEGPDISLLVELIKQGKGVEALVECLTFTPTIDWLDRLPVWRLWHSGPVPKLTRRWINKQVQALVQLGDSATAEDWLELYFTNHEGGNRVLLDYYRHRFVLPRTLATYSLIELLPTQTTILDIACGLGPFPHFLSRRSPTSDVIGFDFNFYLVWWQRRFVAPDQLFLCADGGQNLPFKDDVFGAVYCSDSFVYLPNREQLMSECQRCAPDRPIATTRVANGDAYPKGWGNELGAPGYGELLGGDTLAYRESDLVRYYLDRVNPLQRDATPLSEFSHDKWLYFITNIDESMRTRTLEGVRPHEIGKATLNPMFAKKLLDDGGARFDFSFPSIWFAYQNADMFSYHGDKTECKTDILSHLGTAEIHPELADLAEKFIVIGMPPRYLRDSVP